MTETAIVNLALGLLGLLGVVSTSASVVLAARFQTVKKDIAAVKYEVKNDHKTNLRDENDERHYENSTKLDQVLDTLVWLVTMARENRADITELNEDTGRGATRRARRLAASQPPTIQYSDMPGGTP